MAKNSNLGRSHLSEETLKEKLNLIEEMAKTGSSLAAEQLLSEVEQILDHLQVQKGNQGGQKTKTNLHK